MHQCHTELKGWRVRRQTGGDVQKAAERDKRVEIRMEASVGRPAVCAGGVPGGRTERNRINKTAEHATKRMTVAKAQGQEGRQIPSRVHGQVHTRRGHGGQTTGNQRRREPLNNGKWEGKKEGD